MAKAGTEIPFQASLTSHIVDFGHITLASPELQNAGAGQGDCIGPFQPGISCL